MPRPAVASLAEDDIVIVVVLVVKVVEWFECGHGRGQSSSNGICLCRWEVLGPYILGGWVSSPTPDAIEGRKHNSSTVPYLDYYHRNIVMTPDLTETNKYLSNRINHYQGIPVEVKECTTNLC
jgi:hypothetical protein